MAMKQLLRLVKERKVTTSKEWNETTSQTGPIDEKEKDQEKDGNSTTTRSTKVSKEFLDTVFGQLFIRFCFAFILSMKTKY